MASPGKVKAFVASWLQLGKSVERADGLWSFSPDRILACHGYSEEFEAWWAQAEQDAQKWILSGTQEPLSELLSSHWDIATCSRCDMPISLKVSGVNDSTCPCFDLSTWPNLDLPQPHTPDDTDSKLDQILSKLRR